ncbi:hypothetical protein ACVQX1_004910, partial [Escherichia coli]
MLPSETMIWQPEFTDKTLSRKPGAVQSQNGMPGYLTFSDAGMRTDHKSSCNVSGVSYGKYDENYA